MNGSHFEAWRELLAIPNRSLFVGYAQARAGGQDTSFSYTNDMPFGEKMTALLLTPAGGLAHERARKEFTLAPFDSLKLSVRDWLGELGLERFQGSAVLVHRSDPPAPERERPRHIMTFCRAGPFTTQVGTESYLRLNEPEQRARQSFFMFCPAVLFTDEVTTKIVFFNHATDPTYRDTLTLTPRLNDARGHTNLGLPFAIPPFGTHILDVEAHFGAHVIRRGWRYSVAVSHVGHVTPCLFFHQLRSGEIIAIQHTQPPASIFRPVETDYLVNLGREYRAVIPQPLLRLVKKIARW